MLRITTDIHDEDSYNDFMIGVREESGTMASMVWCACGNVLRSKSVEELNLRVKKYRGPPELVHHFRL